MRHPSMGREWLSRGTVLEAQRGSVEWLSTGRCFLRLRTTPSFTRGAHAVLHLIHVQTDRSHDDRREGRHLYLWCNDTASGDPSVRHHERRSTGVCGPQIKSGKQPQRATSSLLTGKSGESTADQWCLLFRDRYGRLDSPPRT
jgi:hypothetical protein